MDAILKKLNEIVTLAFQKSQDLDNRVKENQELNRKLQDRIKEIEDYKKDTDSLLREREEAVTIREDKIGKAEQILERETQLKTDIDRAQFAAGKEDDRLKAWKEELIALEDSLNNRIKAVQDREAKVTEDEKGYRAKVDREIVDRITGGGKK